MTAAPLPVIDVAPLLAGEGEHAAREIGSACRELGFFYAAGHGVSAATLAALDAASRRFFALPEARKMDIAMAKGGRAWRGYFPVGGELTSGKPDLKQGLYFGEELGPDDPRVAAGLPLHGANLFPADAPDLKPAVLLFMDEAARAAHAIMEGVALSLGLERQYFRRTYTARPTLLFRIFEYPAAAHDRESWGVGEHTDYGLLTLLAQDENGGLQVKTPNGWTDAPPIEGALVCNIGDMLDRLTGGRYKSTPHRVRNISGKSRLSFPFFFDPGWDAEIVPLPAHANAQDDSGERWDRANVHAWSGTYGDYLLGKVSKVFPELAGKVSE
ncbi:MAG TPA: 2-oxoglutarate and iron-dependent oxygenase domain-containing protein [Vitreimonas sp.]|uniref:isopenicillin N synthase family dioxygenase n=1 Tax=Vitreimonas sp. TaxID=3069702 RepID=UPI002D64A838|nr:2-oxoglutarate and iron-dependent oxygenase domain-containing protein [Vitreimonas sp.]HYD86656.1 2-oxoglutarate and iron-dependent oxygenase domain-containing protein [Vitreimonas sp.]